MAELLTPKVGVQARQAGQVSTAPARNLARAASSTKMVADNFTQYYEEQAAIENELILATTQADWTQTYNERKGSAGNGFTKGMLADYDEYVTGAMADAPKRGRDQLQLAMDKYRLNIETKSMQQEAAARAKARAAAIAEANRLKANALISDPSLLDDYLEGAGPKERSLFIRSAMSGQMADNPQSVNDAVMGGTWDADLTPSEKLSFMKLSQSGIDRIDREEATALKASQKLYLDGLSEELDYVSENGALPVDSQYTDENIDAMFVADEAAELKRLRDQSVMHAENRHAVSIAMPSTIEVETAKLKAAVAEPDHTQEDVNALNSYVTAVKQRDQQIATDAANHVQNNVDLIGELFSRYNTSDPEDKPIAAENYVASLEYSYDVMGVPVGSRNLLPKPAVKQMVAQFDGMRPDIVAPSLKEFKDTWGEDSPRIIAELTREGLAPEYIVGMRVADDPGLAAKVVALRGVTDTSLKENLISIEVSDAELAFNEETQEYMSAFLIGSEGDQALNAFNMNRSVAWRLTLQDISLGADPDDAAKANAQKIFPEIPINDPQAQLIYPGEPKEAQAFVKALDTLLDEDTLRASTMLPLDDPRTPKFEDREVAMNALIDNGIWLNNTTGDGAVLHYNIGGYYLPVEIEGGGFYEMKFKDVNLDTRSWLEKARATPLGGFILD